MTSAANLVFFDALYGEVNLPEALRDLARTPAIQRLRDIRLSNIDSLAMPGIANISRYEHALGTAYLATKVKRGPRVAQQDITILGAAAMLHDAGITAMAHLVEEALRYIGRPFEHEQTLIKLVKEPSKTDLGGINEQVYLGYETRIGRWAQKTFGGHADAAIQEILEAQRGTGRWGPFISNDIDLDNLDNLTRIAYHMGLAVNRELPIQLAGFMSEALDGAGRVFDERSIELIRTWLELRRNVYSKLMLSPIDFVGKSMLIYAVVTAYAENDLGLMEQVWQSTDRELLQDLVNSKNSEVSKTARDWLVQDLWPLSDLLWFDGRAPEFPKVMEFSKVAGDLVGRPCFAYRIQDKQVRHVRINTDTGKVVDLGSRPNRWVLGVTSRRRVTFTRRENDIVRDGAREFFNAECVGRAEPQAAQTSSLFE